VAAASRRALKRIGRALGAVAGSLVLAIGLVLLCGWIGSSLPPNSGWREPAPNDSGAVEIMIESNGVHTALVLPLVTPHKDWRGTFRASDVADPSQPYTHVSVSWGEKRVFLDTETWADLKLATVLGVVFGGGEALLHIAHYVRSAPAHDIRPLRLSAPHYARLVRAIEAAIPPGGLGPPHPGYGRFDVFYDANGRYTLANTCNQWTSDVLAASGVRTGRWTPFAGGVMKWVPPLES
jgi:uncharacterized protein (TIGR02117 family)